MSNANQSVRLAGIRAEVERRIGLVPSLFQAAARTPKSLERLWREAREAYLDNPLPSLFKEKLFARLSRFCKEPYCVARHSAFLLGRGHIAGDPGCKPLALDELLELLEQPFPTPEILNSRLSVLASIKGPVRAWPKPASETEASLLTCTAPVFLHRGDHARCLRELRRVLGPARCEHLLALLAFIRKAHFWTETHPRLEFETDLVDLLAGVPALRAWLDSYPAVVSEELRSAGTMGELSLRSAAALEGRKMPRESPGLRRIEGTLPNSAERDQTHAEFLNGLHLDLMHESDPAELVRRALRALVRHLRADHATLGIFDGDGSGFMVTEEAYLDGHPRVRETFRLADYGDLTGVRELQAGRSIVIADVASDPRTMAQAENYRRREIAALVCESLMGTEGPKALVTVESREPRAWRPDELRVLREAATRIFLAHERCEWEKALRASEERYRTLAESAQDMIFIIGRDDTVQYVNASAARNLGMKAEDILGQPRALLFPSPIAERQSQDLLRVIETGRPLCINNVAVLGGREIWLDTMLAPLRDPAGGVCGVLGIARDINDRKETEQALRRSEELQHAIFQSLPAHIAVVDREGIILAVNEAWRRFAAENEGADLPSVAVGANYLEVCRRAAAAGEPGAQSALAGIQSVLAGESVNFVQEYPCHSPEEERWFSMSVVPLGLQGKGGVVISHQNITGRKNAEDELRRSREDLDRAQAVGQLGSWRLDARSNVLTWSAEKHWIYRVAPGTPLSYELFLSLVHPDDRESVDRKWKAALKGKPYDVEHRILVDGEVKWVRSKAFLEFDSKADLLGAFGICQDITERKLAEQALRESEAFLGKVLHSSLNGVYIHDLQRGIHTFINRQFTRLTGYTLLDLRAMTRQEFLALTHPEDRMKLDEHLAAVVRTAGREVLEIEYRFQTADGQWIWCLSRDSVFSRDHRGAPQEVIGTFLDITARKTAEQDLRESEERLRLAQAAAGVGIWDWDLASGTIRWTPDLEKMYGYEPGAFPGTYKGFRDRVHPGDLPDVERQCDEALNVHRELNFDFRILLPSGDVRWINAMGAVIYDEAGIPRRVLGANVDITHRKALELELKASLQDVREAQDELVRQERLAMLGRLAGSVAHEIRTPLAVITNSLFYLQQNLQPDDVILQEVLAEIDRAVGYSDRVISALLEYVREPSPLTVSFPVRNAISHALEQVHIPEAVHLRWPSAEAQKIEVRANLEQVSRILVLLTENAIQAMPDGGQLEFGVLQIDGRVCIDVRDTGCGVAEANQERIFEPLFSTKNTGIGLGLPIARRHARLNGGELAVESQVGRGSTFRLILNPA